jgi:hypothetical protein
MRVSQDDPAMCVATAKPQLHYNCGETIGSRPRNIEQRNIQAQGVSE